MFLFAAACPWLALGAAAADPCAAIAGNVFVPPAQALACYKSFPFNETLRQNVLDNMDRVFDFFTFEDYYLNSPPPFQESTVNIRAKLAGFRTQKFAVGVFINFVNYRLIFPRRTTISIKPCMTLPPR